MRILNANEMAQIYGTGGDGGGDGGGGGDSGGVSCSATDSGMSCSATSESGASISGGISCTNEANSSTTCSVTATACTPEGQCVTGSFSANSGQALACSVMGVGVGAMAAPTGFGPAIGFAASQACNAAANTQTGNGASFSFGGK